MVEARWRNDQTLPVGCPKSVPTLFDLIGSDQHAGQSLAKKVGLKTAAHDVLDALDALVTCQIKVHAHSELTHTCRELAGAETVINGDGK